MVVHFANTGSPSKASPGPGGGPGTTNSVENLRFSTLPTPLYEPPIVPESAYFADTGIAEWLGAEVIEDLL